MRKLGLKISGAVITFSLGVGVHYLTRTEKPSTPALRVMQSRDVHVPDPAVEETISNMSDLFSSDESVEYNGYLIENRYKVLKLGFRFRVNKQAFIAISKNHKTLLSFDARRYFRNGNVTEFGVFSFLGPGTKQVAISQEVPRSGAQWIVDFDPAPRVVFDGPAWGVGRESADCEVHDIDGDGIYEITLPIADFYSLMDKMEMAGAPLPPITFRYDRAKKKYLPVNHLLNTAFSDGPDVVGESNDLYVRSGILCHTLELIYRGKRNKAWQYFDSAYNLADKEEIRQRVQKILRDQPVYKYIYNNDCGLNHVDPNC